MSEISTAARQELVQAIGGRYRTGSADEKGRILDEFVALTSYHRKHAIRVLNELPGTPTSTRRGRLRLYNEAVRQALVVFWEASDRICGKRLKPLLPILLPALERHGHLSLDPVRCENSGEDGSPKNGRVDAFEKACASGTSSRSAGLRFPFPVARLPNCQSVYSICGYDIYQHAHAGPRTEEGIGGADHPFNR